MRLLSFLNSIEDSIRADSPTAPNGNDWENARTVNFQLGLARLILGSRATAGTETQGTILLQSFALADGSVCLKANLSWAGRESEADTVYSVYEKIDVNWKSEARRIAASWLSGPPARAAADVHEQLAAAG